MSRFNDISAQSEENAFGSVFQQWTLVGVLTVIYALSWIDRGAISIVVNPIKADFGISDLQMSLLLGLSFVTLYSLLSIPAGYVADFMNRRLLIFFAVLFWSAMSVLCGIAGSYWQLFAGRIGLGMGEAVLPPAAYSLIRDGVSPHRQGRAFAIYQIGVTLGVGLGALVAGELFSLGGAGGFANLPLIGFLKPWQIVLAIPGLCGLGLAFMVLLLREPPRPDRISSASDASFRAALLHIFRHRRVYLPLIGAVVAVSMGGYGWTQWLPAAMGRAWNLSPGVTGRTLGLIGVVVFPLSALFLGWLMDRAKRGDRVEGPFLVSIVGCLLNLPPVMSVFLAPSASWMWCAYAFSILLNGGVQIACGAVLARITPSHLMGKIAAIYFLLTNLLGVGVGVSGVAALAQLVFIGPMAIAHAMMSWYAAFAVLQLICLGIGVRQLRRWRMEPSPSLAA